MTDPLAHVWAKSPRNDQESGEPLTGHTANVIARLSGWRARYPDLPSHTSRADLWDLAAWACALHDIGKCARGFQDMLRKPRALRFPHRHEVLSLVAVGKLDVDEETRALIAAGVATHHRDLPEIFESYGFGSGDRDDLLKELSHADEEAWGVWLSESLDPVLARFGFAKLPKLLPMDRAKALGLAMAALRTRFDDLEVAAATSKASLAFRAMRGLVILADHAGSAHVRLGEAEALDSTQAFASALGQSLYSHQAECARTDGSALLIAPTGSGKTEAALLWAARQREMSTGRPSVFYLLPYRASLNAMRGRIPGYGIPDDAVVLQHSSAATALYTMLLSKGYEPKDAAKTTARERDLARLMTAPVRVMTPYQLLRSIFGLRGHEAMLTDAAGGLFVLDELHAYDIQRLALILCLLEHLTRDLGARLFAMSATFPTVLTETLDEILGGRLARVNADDETLSRFVRHELHLLDADLEGPDVRQRIIERYERGEAVLVVATTVGRAQAIFDALAPELGDDVRLLHSRFTQGDRAAKERDIAEIVGTKTRKQMKRGLVLVATQVVEVSLDIDFDVLFTDPAPIEALIQRFGRINRGRRGGLRDVFVTHGGGMDGCNVYEAWAVSHAIDILRPHAGQAMHEETVQTWVDRAYEPIREQWQRRLRVEMQRARDDVLRANHPLTSHDELSLAFDRLFDGCEVVPVCHWEDYRRFSKEEPLRAPFFRVPISFGQQKRLEGLGKLSRRGDDLVAHVPYDMQRGLTLDV